jgi:3-phenylpropionate/trans-cinnamate dioxygenase ferredoxin component
LTSFPVGAAEAIRPGTMVGVDAGGDRILVANLGGEFYAMRAKCNHMGGPLDKGTLEGDVVTCPLHGSRWDVKTGKLMQFTRPLPDEKTYKVTLKNGMVSVEV